MRNRGIRDTNRKFDFEAIAAGFLVGWLPVADEGYEVRALKVDRYGTRSWADGLVVVPVGEWETSYPVMTATRSKGLHRKFANLARSNQGLDSRAIVAFANKFGLLEGSYIGMEEVYEPGKSKPTLLPIRSSADDFWEWVHLPCDLAAYIELWDLVRDNRRDELERFVRNEGGNLTFYYAWDGVRLNTNPGFWARSRSYTAESEDGRLQWEVVVSADTAGEFPLLRDEATRAVEVTRLFLYNKINEGLEDQVQLTLTGYRPPESALIVQPRNLLGAIWLQFAREIMGEGPSIMYCANPECQKPTHFRRGKKYCCDACRASASRIRRQSPPSVLA